MGTRMYFIGYWCPFIFMYVDEEIERLGVFFIDACRMKRGNTRNVFCVFIFICIRREREIIFFIWKIKKGKDIMCQRWCSHIASWLWIIDFIIDARIEYFPDNSICRLRYDYYNSLNSQSHESMDFEQWTNRFCFLDWHLYVLNHIMSRDVANSWIIF